MTRSHSIMTRLLHATSAFITKRGRSHFEEATHHVEQIQRERLKNTLKLAAASEHGRSMGITEGMSVEQFQQKIPISEYQDWHDVIVRQRATNTALLTNESCDRYQPTSGSTSKIKWIPYTPAFLKELDAAINPWMSDLYQRYPGIKNGRHYWSLSWVPSDLRDEVDDSINDDLKLLPWWKRLFLGRTMAVPESVSLAESSEESFFATCCFLAACRDLSMISVWSPTFAMSLLATMQEHREKLAEVLETGRWVAPFAGLSFVDAPKSEEAAQILREWDGEINPDFTVKMWPHLALISSWDTSSSKEWARQLHELFPHSGFQGKGLWATEGVVTFPIGADYPLSIQSHFYEFEDLDSGKIYTAWQLHTGQRVRPIITTANGLLRYATKDQLTINGFLNHCPLMTFISRIDGVDMVGEKLSPDVAVSLMDEIAAETPLKPVTLLALPSTGNGASARYTLLCSGSCDAVDSDHVNNLVEQKLLQHFHYDLARELNQLAPASVTVVEDAMDIYLQHKIDRGMVVGNIKIEPLVLWQSDLLPEALQTPDSVESSAELERVI